MNFYDVLAAKNWDGGIPTINFFDLLFAQSVSGEAYEGTLPATINANGDDMRQYQIYGATGGVGDRTKNLLDESTLVKGFYTILGNKIIIFPDSSSSTVYRSFRQSFAPGTYTISFGNNVFLARVIVDGVMSENIGENISSYTVTTQTGDIGFSMRRTTSSATQWNDNPTMLTEGSTPPETYVPYGYEVDMSVSDGTTSTTTPIYIGDDPLDKDEYADYQAGKIYRMSGGTLTPTDPPVPLPALPTVEGETIVDYAGAKTETTKNILPSAQAQTLTVNGNTCTCDGQGRYHVDMSNNTDTNFAFSIPNFIIPISVGQGGNGTWSMFNTATQSMQVKLYYNDTEIDYWSINAANRTSDSYSNMGGKTINKIVINAWNASVDGDFAFMFTDDGVLPAEFVPHEIAKPTPEKVLFEYKKG